MAWTYDASPGTSTAAERRDAVRFFVGDTDTNDQQVQDAEITFALSEAGDNVYGAAAIVARSIAGLYARRVDTAYGPLRTSYSQRRDNYLQLASRMEREAKLGGGIGSPIAGGVSISEIDSVEDDSDRPKPAFKRDQFRNPPDTGDADNWWDFHN